jgi:hypothetical protein
MPENKITAGQANITLAHLLKGSKDKFFGWGSSIRDYQQQQSTRSGWGRTFGGLLGGFAISALTGGAATPWMIAAGVGVGSRVGSEIGERTAKGRKKYGTDLLFGRTKAKEANRGLDRYYKDFNTQQNIHALYDAASGYLSAGNINKGVKNWNSAKGMGLGGWEGLFNTEGFQQQLQKDMVSMAPKADDAASLLKADTSSLGTFKGFDLDLGLGSANVDNSILSRLQSPAPLASTANPATASINPGFGGTSYPLQSAGVDVLGTSLYNSAGYNFRDFDTTPLGNLFGRQGG